VADREFVKDLTAVQELNSLLKENKEFIDGATDSAGNMLNTIQKHGEVLQTSLKYSKQSKKEADLMVQVNKAGLKYAKSKSTKDKEALDNLKKQVDSQTNLTKEADRHFKKVFKGAEEIHKQRTGMEKLGDLTKQVGEAAKNQIPYYKEASMILKGGVFRFVALTLLTLKITQSVLKEFQKRIGLVGDEFGAIGMMNQQFKSDILAVTGQAKKLGFGVKEVATVVKELTTDFGVGRDEALRLTNTILDTSKALGITTQEGTKLIGTLTEVAGLSFQISNQFAKQTALLAEAEGASPNAVLKDIASSSKEIAKFIGETPEALFKAAIQANKLGLSLKDITGTARSLLNFQESLNLEIEASILLGRDVNLQKARELALAGDTEALAVEITKQVGSQADFEKMNVLQKEALAKALFMEEEQLAKIINNQEKINSINGDISKQGGFEDILGRNALDNITQIKNDFASIGAQFANTIGPFVSSVVSGIASFTGYLAESPNLVRGLAGGLAALATSSIVAAIGLIFKSFSMIPFGVGIPLAVGAIASMMTKVSSAKNVALQEGGIVTREINNATIGEAGAEAVVPLHKLGGMMRDAMAGVVAENRRLVEESKRQTEAIGRIGNNVASNLVDMA
tara:strand:+ start:307 stop:2187 length:1881 start_codon:yes stop_codon:yes gene_type:complete